MYDIPQATPELSVVQGRQKEPLVFGKYVFRVPFHTILCSSNVVPALIICGCQG